MSLKKIQQAIGKNKTFLLSTHVNPDPDAICSQLALGLYLKSLKKKVYIINEKQPPKRLKIFPGVKIISGLHPRLKVRYDAAIILDCGELSRIGKVVDILDRNKPLINIDHHITNDRFGSLNLVLPAASSTAEVLYGIIKSNPKSMTRDIAINLYAGILTDTGSFRYENTTRRTHQIVGELLRFDIPITRLYEKLYETIPLKDIQAYSAVINKFDSYNNGKTIIVELTKETIARFSDAFDLRDTIFKFLRSIKGVEVIAILTEVSQNETRVNFRSIKRVDVAKLAADFNGGGHKRASGCIIAADLKTSRQKLLEKLRTKL